VLYKSLPYDPFKYFAPITLGAIQSNILTVPTSLVNTPNEFFELLKKNPGKYNYASVGAGTVAHLSIGMVAPVSTPPALVDKINRECVEAMKSPEVLEKIRAQYMEPIGNSPQAFAEFMQSERISET
jgi:tripartite-type tricarboxylate transporter receptor subunit TctC